MSPSTAINQCILSFPQACRRQTEESNFFVTDMYSIEILCGEHWYFSEGAEATHCWLADFALYFLVSINFFHHHTFLQAVFNLGSGSMSLWARTRKIISDPQTCLLFSGHLYSSTTFFPLTPPWFYHFIFLLHFIFVFFLFLPLMIFFYYILYTLFL